MSSIVTRHGRKVWGLWHWLLSSRWKAGRTSEQQIMIWSVETPRTVAVQLWNLEGIKQPGMGLENGSRTTILEPFPWHSFQQDNRTSPSRGDDWLITSLSSRKITKICFFKRSAEVLNIGSTATGINRIMDHMGSNNRTEAPKMQKEPPSFGFC